MTDTPHSMINETIKDFQKTNEPVDFVKMGLMGKIEDTKVATGQIEGKETKPRTIDQRIAWNSAINNAVHTIEWKGFFREEEIKEIKSRAEKIYKLITEGN